MSDPFEPLSAAAFAARMGDVSPTAIRLREQNNEVFSILPPGCEIGRGYPAFQAWPEVAGEPLRQTLSALGQLDCSTPYGFFSSASPELYGLSPVEALYGHLLRSRSLNPLAQELLSLSGE